jgi:ATP-dependent Clp protease ATP-binding subunit ClpC
MKSVEQSENELLRRVAFFARYEASTLGTRQIEWPHLFLGLMREGRPVLRNFFGSHEAYVVLGIRIRESLPAQPSVSTSVDIPMAEDCEALIKDAARRTRVRTL